MQNNSDGHQPQSLSRRIHLHAVLLSAVTAVRRPKAEAAGAALGVAGIEGESPQVALVTPRTFHIFLEKMNSG